MTKRMGVAQVKARLAEILREVEGRGERVVVERRGRAVAIIQPYDPRDDVAEQQHWAEALDGIAGDIEDFDEIMEQVVSSRPLARPRTVDLDGEG